MLAARFHVIRSSGVQRSIIFQALHVTKPDFQTAKIPIRIDTMDGFSALRMAAISGVSLNKT